jgi:hypothetical protein
VGQINMQAGIQATPANAQPISRDPTAEAGWATATGNTKVKSAAVDAVAASGVTIPAKRTANPTTAITTTDATFCVETTVPIEIRQLPTRNSVT